MNVTVKLEPVRIVVRPVVRLSPIVVKVSGAYVPVPDPDFEELSDFDMALYYRSLML